MSSSGHHPNVRPGSVRHHVGHSLDWHRASGHHPLPRLHPEVAGEEEGDDDDHNEDTEGEDQSGGGQTQCGVILRQE